jgi:hypothetical protein
MIQRGFHPHFAIAQFDWEDRYVVCPKIKGAAAFEIEAGVMPMTRQDAILDGASLEWEAHVRTTIVESEDAAAIVDDKDWTMTAAKNEAAFRLQLLKAARGHKFPVGYVHPHSSRVSTHYLNIGIISRKRERAPRSARSDELPA